MLTQKEFAELLAAEANAQEETAGAKRERDERTRQFNVSSGMVQCGACGAWYVDAPGNYCSHS